MRAAAFHCVQCQAHRLHTVSRRLFLNGKQIPNLATFYGFKLKRKQLKITRCRRCSVCELVTDLTYKEQPGLACPSCSNARFRVSYTRHRMGGTIRVKQCTYCHHRVRTFEKFESLAHT